MRTARRSPTRFTAMRTITVSYTHLDVYKRQEDGRTIPILAMTADAFVEDIESAKAAGMNGHLSKPVDFELLGREIRKYLNRS